MKKNVYLLNMNEETKAILTEIAERIPCFIWEEKSNAYNQPNWSEIAIECREADAAFVENMLAPVI